MSTELTQFVETLESDLTLTLSEIFDKTCQEFGLDGDSIAQSLGCKCPYGLIGYVSA